MPDPGLIGDAMGAPAEGKTYRQVAEQFAQITDFEGAGTDDSAIKLILCDAILKSGGYVTADEFAESFLRHKEKYHHLFYIPVRNMFHKIESKLSLPIYTGLGNMHSSSTAMSISPMGIINAGNPRQAAIETFDVAGLIHAGDSTFCRDGACAMAAAVAEAMGVGSTVESVIDAATAYLHRQSSVEMATNIRETLDMARRLSTYEAFREEFYRTRLRDIASDSRETVPCVLSLFLLSNGDPNTAIVYGANFGRDADTIGTMAGALSGAFKGASGLKPEWVKKVEASYDRKIDNSKGEGIQVKMPNQAKLADQLVKITVDRADAQALCAEKVRAMAAESR